MRRATKIALQRMKIFVRKKRMNAANIDGLFTFRVFLFFSRFFVLSLRQEYALSPAIRFIQISWWVGCDDANYMPFGRKICQFIGDGRQQACGMWWRSLEALYSTIKLRIRGSSGKFHSFLASHWHQNRLHCCSFIVLLFLLVSAVPRANRSYARRSVSYSWCTMQAIRSESSVWCTQIFKRIYKSHTFSAMLRHCSQMIHLFIIPRNVNRMWLGGTDCSDEVIV